MTMNKNNNKQTYLYLDNSAVSGKDTRPIIGYVGSVAVPQYPVKASELEKLFKDIPYLDILEDIDNTVREAADKQQAVFAQALGISGGRVIDLLVGHERTDGTAKEKAFLQCCKMYNRSFYDVESKYYLDDVYRLYEQWRAQTFQATNAPLAELIKAGYLSMYSGFFYLINDKTLLYSIAENDDGYGLQADKEPEISYALFDVTSCVWQQIKAYYDIPAGDSITFESWAAGRSYRDIMDAIARAVWGFEDSTGFTPVRKIKSL